MAYSADLLPDGSLFPFWDDLTTYTRVYHVAREHPAASDVGPCTETQPFMTINRAAELLQPGEKVIIHGGLYRECVRPARGGLSADRMIAYEAAPGERVIVRGSESLAPPYGLSQGWRLRGLPAGAVVWTADLPAASFVGYNPFLARNFSSEYTTFTSDWRREETHTFMLRRGMVFADGVPLRQVFFPSDLAREDGVFWVEDPGLRIHFRLVGDADPAQCLLEVTTREQVFAPLLPGLGYIRVSGLHLEHAADGIPVPQRALLSASRGHHWIIEDCHVRWANACGIDVGDETWHREHPRGEQPSGHHILRRNTVSDCGICGIAAIENNAYTLVEDNTVERIGGLHIERVWETGGLKFHECNGVLIRRNVFRHIVDAPGIWLDYLNHNTRVTGNVIADVQTIIGGIYVEVSHAPNAVDHNILWDIRGTGSPGSGKGINVDTGEYCTVAHNLLGQIPDEYAVSANLAQRERIVGGRVGLCAHHQILNNLFYACPHRIFLGRALGNVADGNCFDDRDDATSLCLETPAPRALLNLEAWQTFLGFDVHSVQGPVSVGFDLHTLELSVQINGVLPACVEVPALHGDRVGDVPGPVAAQEALRVRAGVPSG